MAKNDKIIIVGGGIGGLTLALGLQKFNIPFHLYEKAPVFTEVGAGVGLSSNALFVYEQLDIIDEIRAHGYALKTTVIADHKIKALVTVPFPDEAYCIHRAELVEILSSQLEMKNFTLGANIDGIDLSETGAILKLASGESLEPKCVIAADGIHSVIRKQVFPTLKKRYSGDTIWRGIVDQEIPKRFRSTYTECMSKGVRFLFLPMTQKRIFWLAVKPAPYGERDDPKTVISTLQSYFAAYDPFVNELIGQTDPERILRNDLEDIKPSYKSWHHRNVGFIGDAIHATTPNLAQGACQAIEDAFAMACLLKDHSYEEAFAKFQRIRMKKVKYVVNQSWMVGKMAITKNAMNDFLLHGLFKLMPSSMVMSRYKKLVDVSYLNELVD